MTASLEQLHSTAGAQFGPWPPGNDSIASNVWNYGDAAAEFHALNDSAGLCDLSARTQLELRGEDRASFLHNFCTNQIKTLEPGRGCEAFFLDARGRTLGHAFIFCRQDGLVIDALPGDEARLLRHLDRYRIRERVEFVPHTPSGADVPEVEAAARAPWGQLLLAGPQAAAQLKQCGADAQAVDALLASPLLSHAELKLANQSVWARTTPWTRSGAVSLVGDYEAMGDVWQALVAAGAQACGWESLEVARIEAGLPLFGQDFDEKNLAQELDRTQSAISFTKGCYLGQETVARLDALGHVNKLLVRLAHRLPVDRKSIAETRVLVPPGLPLENAGESAGQLTSAAWSPTAGTYVALAIVRAGAAEPGTTLSSAAGSWEVQPKRA